MNPLMLRSFYESGIMAVMLGAVPLLLARPLLSRRLRWIVIIASIALGLAVDQLLLTALFFVNVTLAYGCLVALRMLKASKPTATTIEDVFFATTLAGCVAAELFQVVNSGYNARSLLLLAYAEMQIVVGVLAAVIVNRFDKIRGSAITVAVLVYGASICLASSFYRPTNMDTWLLKNQIAIPLVPTLTTFFAALIALRFIRRGSASPTKTVTMDPSPSSDSSGQPDVLVDLPRSEV